MLGLSQLHQLRGRVGRGRERAYAYFLYPPEKPLTETAHDRLATIAQHTDLGAGMADRDEGPRDPRRRQPARRRAVRPHRRRRLRPLRPAGRRGGRRVPRRRRRRSRPRSRSSCRSTPTCRTTTSPGERLRLEAYQRLAAVERRGRPGRGRGRAARPLRHRRPSRCATCSRWPGSAPTPARPGSPRSASQGNYVRFAPVELPESRAAAAAAALPGEPWSRPRSVRSSCRAPMTARVGGQPLRDTALLSWASDLIDAVLLDQMADAARVAAPRKGTAVKALRTARPSVRTAAAGGPRCWGRPCCCPAAATSSPARRRSSTARVIADTDAQQVAAQISTVPGVQQKVTPADTLVSLILRAVRHRPGGEGRQGDLRVPGARRGRASHQGPVAGDARVRPAPAWPRTASSEQAARGRPGRGRARPTSPSTPATARSTARRLQLTPAGAQLDRGRPPPSATADPAGPGRPRLRSSSGRPADPAPVDPAHRAGAALARGLVDARARRRRSWAGTPTSRSCWPSRTPGSTPPPSATCTPAELARLLVDRATEADVVWVGSSDGDPGLTDALAAEVSRRDDPPEVEMLVGSYDVPGSRLLDLVAVMDRLRSPGGCPWDAEQTHESLVPYLLEEAYEAVEAIETGDRGAPARGARRRAAAGGVPRPDRPGAPERAVRHRRRRRRHRREARPAPPARLRRRRRRHGRRGVEANWEPIKAAEKAGRTSALDGIPAGLPALPGRQACRDKAGLAGCPGAGLTGRRRRSEVGGRAPAGRRGPRCWRSSPEAPRAARRRTPERARCATPVVRRALEQAAAGARSVTGARGSTVPAVLGVGRPSLVRRPSLRSVCGQHRSRRRPRDPRLARQPHRRGRGRPRRRHHRPRRRALRRLHRRVRGRRAARRRQEPLRRQGRREGRRRRRSTRSAPRSSASTPASSASSTRR